MRRSVQRLLLGLAAVVLLAAVCFCAWGWYQDSQPPVLECVTDAEVECGETLTVYSLVRSVTGNGAVTLTLSGGEAAEDGKSTVFTAADTYTVTVTATDEDGHQTECQVSVLARDTIAPVLKATAFSVCLGEDIDYLSTVTAVDAVEGDLLSQVQVNASQVDTENTGTYLVQYSVSDSAGNTAQTTAYLTILAPSASAVTLSETEYTLPGNGSVQLTVTVEPENWQGTVTWSSSDETIAIVYGGLVSWVGEGEAVITAAAGDVTAQCAIRCTEVAATSVALNYHKAILAANTSVTLTAQTLPSNYSGGVVWRSSDETVATVKNGVLTWVGEGTCTVTATAGDAVDSCAVTCQAVPVVVQPEETEKTPSLVDTIKEAIQSLFGGT
ncbi:MAG: Ig-like domain-containing protein [Clostridiales bacterium]|nr:Ig-like domain-containing protein [Clostridiales bacterium]